MMDDAKILAEVERRLRACEKEGDGWYDEKAGFHMVLRLIDKLRNDGAAPEHFELGY